jgi:hypothetical protein
MRDITYGDDGLPPDFAGGNVAWLDDEVLLTAENCNELADRLNQTAVDQARVVIGYVEPADAVRVFGSLPIRIGTIELPVRCLFLDQRKVPYILGCADVLERFALTIDAGQGKIILTEIT